MQYIMVPPNRMAAQETSVHLEAITVSVQQNSTVYNAQKIHNEW